MRLCKTLILSVVGLLARVEAGPSVIQVGENVQVSSINQRFEHNEVLGCADPNHPERLMVVSIIDDIDQFHPWTIAYVSFDGGKSWTVGVQNHPSGKLLSEDPACTYASDGTAYFVSFETDVAGEFLRGNSNLYRSPDGGRTWFPPSIIFGAWDRPFVVVDRSGGKYSGRIYVNHTGAGGQALQRSLDRGQTFLGPVFRPSLQGTTNTNRVPRSTDLQQNPANSVVLSAGTLVSLFWEESSGDKGGWGTVGTGSVKIVRSVDGGEHYQDEIKVADYSFDHQFDGKRAITFPNIAVDPGSRLFKDRLYAVWQNATEGQKTKASQESVLSYSTDEGKTWSSPTRISYVPNAAATIQYQTTVAVNKEGVVGVMWYEGFETATTEGYWVKFAASLDGGDTWTPAVRVSKAPCLFGATESVHMNGSADNEGWDGQLKLQLWPYVWLSSGHTAGLAADARGVFHAFWVDNRTGKSQVYTAPIAVSGLPVRNGGEKLAELEDLTGKVKMEVSHIYFNRTNGAVSATVGFRNISDHIITAPLKLRVTALRSDLGIPKLWDAENSLDGDGAILNLTDSLPSGALRPGEDSAEKVLKLQIVNVQPLRTEGKWLTYGEWRILTLKGRIYGKTQP